MSVTVSTALIDDDARFAADVARWLGTSPGIQFLGHWANGVDAIRVLPELKPDVVLVDVNMPRLDGVSTVRKLKPVLPSAQFVMLTVYEDAEHVFAALEAGATGYLLKTTGRADLAKAILDVQAGGSPMSSHIARKVVQRFQRP